MDLMVELFASWGKWVVFTGVLVSILIEVWRRQIKTVVFEDMSPIAKRTVVALVSGLGVGAAAAVAGVGWQAALMAAGVSWGSALITGDILRGWVEIWRA